LYYCFSCLQKSVVVATETDSTTQMEKEPQSDVKDSSSAEVLSVELSAPPNWKKLVSLSLSLSLSLSPFYFIL